MLLMIWGETVQETDEKMKGGLIPCRSPDAPPCSGWRIREKSKSSPFIRTPAGSVWLRSHPVHVSLPQIIYSMSPIKPRSTVPPQALSVRLPHSLPRVPARHAYFKAVLSISCSFSSSGTVFRRRPTGSPHVQTSPWLEPWLKKSSPFTFWPETSSLAASAA